MGSRLGQRASKSACVVVPLLFRADSGTNLIKQGEIVKGRPCGSVAQLAECSHGKREALGSSPGWATIFSSPVIMNYRRGIETWTYRKQALHGRVYGIYK